MKYSKFLFLGVFHLFFAAMVSEIFSSIISSDWILFVYMKSIDFSANLNYFVVGSDFYLPSWVFRCFSNYLKIKIVLPLPFQFVCL